MTNKEKYTNAFIEAFNLEEAAVPTLKYQDIPEWDSVGHMGLVTALENAFEIMLKPADLINLSSYDKGKEILLNYGVEIN